MAKDASLFSYLNIATKNKIYVANNFALDIANHCDLTYQHGQIVDVYHVLSLIVNLLFIS